MMGTGFTLISDLPRSETAWLARALRGQQRLAVALAERSNRARTKSRVLEDAVRERLAASRTSLVAVHDRRRQFFQPAVRLARRDPGLRRVLPVAGASAAVLSLDAEDRPEGHIIRVSGEIDLANVSQLHAALEPAVGNNQSVIIDLSGVTYLDSTTLHAILTSDRELKRRERRLVIVGPPFLFKLLRVTGLLGHLTAVPSLADAVRTLGSRAPI